MVETAPSNVKFMGYIDRKEIAVFVHMSRFIILPSIWFEGAPMVIVEAMLHRKPVICSRIGGLPEIVDDGVTGLLVEPGNPDDLADKIRYLWERPNLCIKMGHNGREKALLEYSPEKYYERLMSVYHTACMN